MIDFVVRFCHETLQCPLLQYFSRNRYQSLVCFAVLSAPGECVVCANMSFSSQVSWEITNTFLTAHGSLFARWQHVRMSPNICTDTTYSLRGITSMILRT